MEMEQTNWHQVITLVNLCKFPIRIPFPRYHLVRLVLLLLAPPFLLLNNKPNCVVSPVAVFPIPVSIPLFRTNYRPFVCFELISGDTLFNPCLAAANQRERGGRKRFN